jgi:hypothetical protein
MKYWDIKPVCPTAHRHYHIRRFFASLPTRGVINDQYAALFVFDRKDPCKSHIVKEPIDKLPQTVYTGNIPIKTV